MFKAKSKQPYWQQFSSYQTFQTEKELNEAVKRFVAFYDLTDAIKAVLNTIKLHAKRYFGVCWLRKEKIAQKAGVSPSTVDRAIKGLKETGFLTVIPFNHTKFGRRTHNIYVINHFYDISDDATQEVHSVASDNVPQNVANEVARESFEESVKPCVATGSDDRSQTHKNPHTNSNKTFNHLSIKRVDELKFVPNEFIDLMEPFYANNPEIIRERWKTVCVAAKRSGLSAKTASFDSIRQAWKDVVRFYKRGKIKNSTDDGIGGYFYGVLCDYLLNDCLRSLAKNASSFMKGDAKLCIIRIKKW